MEITEENEHTVKFLVPEIVRRSKAVATVKKSSKHATPHVDKVYESKKRYLAKLNEQYQALQDSCGDLKQKEKSVLLKQNATLSSLTQTMRKGNQLNTASRRLDEEFAQLIEEYEKAMQECDVAFTESLVTYNDKNLPLLCENLKGEIAELGAEIEAILKEPGEVVEDEPGLTSLTLHQIMQTPELTEEKHLEDLKKQELLQNQLSQLQKELALLEAEPLPDPA